jgi:hypothetical protein
MTLISRCRVEKLGEVLHESAVEHVNHTLKLVRKSTVHVYRRNPPGLSCPQRLSGQFFALEDLGDLWRLEDRPELDSGWRLGGVGVHRIMQPTNCGAVHHRQAVGIKNCMRLRQLFPRHAHLVVVCMMRPKHCLAIRDQFKQQGCRYRRVCERRLEVLFLVIRDIC